MYYGIVGEGIREIRIDAMKCDQLLLICLAAAWTLFGPAAAIADEPKQRELDRRFAAEVQPFLKTYCLGCHGPERQEGKLNLASYDSLSAVKKNQQIWELILERLKGKEMPPEDAPKQPKDAERRS